MWRIVEGPRENVLPSYAYSDDKGDTWHAIDGTQLTLPITPVNAAAARIPGNTRLTSIDRSGGIVAATADDPNHGIVAGQSVAVRISDDNSFDGTFTVAVVSGTAIFWGQAGADTTAGPGFLSRGEGGGLISGGGVTVDDDGNPHMIISAGPSWWIRHNGTTWTSSTLANPLHGVTHSIIAACHWQHGNLYMLKWGSPQSRRRPRIWQITGSDQVVFGIGGEVDSRGLNNPVLDPEAARLFDTIEVLTPDGNTPRVATFGRAARAAAA
jgi:hypothetical protein